MNDDIKIRRLALTRLAIATRERLPESQEDRHAFFKVYLDGTEGFSNDTFCRACRNLENSIDWFPKKHELIEACRAVLKFKLDQRKPQLALPSGDKPIAPEKWREFQSCVQALIQRKRMR